MQLRLNAIYGHASQKIEVRTGEARVYADSAGHRRAAPDVIRKAKSQWSLLSMTQPCTDLTAESRSRWPLFALS